MTRAEASTALGWYAAFAFALVGLLGYFVSSRTPTRVDLEATALRGAATQYAALLTALGYWPTLTFLSVVAVLGLVAEPGSAFLSVGLVASHTLSQIVVVAVKPLFRRARPDNWLVRQEDGTSYPSGHSSTAITFYFALLLIVWRLEIPVLARIVFAAALVCCVAGIPWSRLALGAHYLTDVAGGTIFGTAWLAASIALLLRFGPP